MKKSTVTITLVFFVIFFLIGTNFILAKALPGPVITNPSDKADLKLGDLKIIWGDVPGATFYKITLRDLTSGEKLLDGEPVAKTSYTVQSSSIYTGHNYSVAVASCATGFTDSWSTPITFSIKALLPAPVIKNPSNNDILELGEVTVTWKEAAGASAYKLNLEDLTTGKIDQISVIRNSITIRESVLEAGHNYKITVAGVLFNSNGALSAPVYFSVKSRLTGPVITSPADNSVLAPGEVAVRWNNVPGVGFYRINLKDETTGAKLLDNEPVYQTGYTIPASMLTAGHNYKIIISSHATNNTVGLGAPVNFRIMDKTVKPEIKSPLDNSLLEYGEVTVSWTSVPNAKTYKFYLKDETTGEKIFNNIFVPGSSFTIPATSLDGGHNYTMAVGVLTRDSGESWSAPVSFRIKDTLAGPVITSPLDNAVLELREITVTWKSVPRASLYKFRLRDTTTGQLVYDDQLITRTYYSIQASSLKAGHDYKIHVASCVPNYADSWGVPVSFRINNRLPVPVITAPEDNASLEPGNIIVKWENLPGIVSNLFSLRDETTGEKLIDGIRVTGTSYTIPAALLTAGHNYKVAVAGSTAYNTGDWSVPVRFNVKLAAMLAAPELKSPLDEAIYELQDLPVIWDRVPNAQGYRLSLKDTTTQTSIINNYSLSATHYTIPANSLMEGHNYQLMVAAYAFRYKDGVTECLFRIKSRPRLAAPSITFPLDGTSLELADYKFTWNPVSGAAFYQFSLRDVTTGQKVIEKAVKYATSFLVTDSLLAAGHQYRLSVTAVASGSREGKSEIGFKINTIQVLSVPRITSPANGAVLEPGRVVVTWEAVMGAASYRISIRDLYTDQNFANTVKNENFVIPALSEGHLYLIKVAAFTNDQRDRWSEPVYVYSRCSSSPTPEITGFSKNVMLDLRDLPVTWNGHPSAKYYKLALVDLTTGQSTLKSFWETSYVIPQTWLEVGHKYSIAVAGCSRGYGERWGSAVQFTIKDIFSSALEIISPHDGAVLEGAVKVIWQSVPDATFYLVELEDLNDGTKADPVFVRETSYLIPASQLNKGHEYKVTVSACGDNYLSRICEQPVTFKIRSNSRADKIEKIIDKIFK